MQYISKYQSFLGEMLITCDDEALTSLKFIDQDFNLPKYYQEKETLIIKRVKKWLDIYFKGQEPDFFIPLHSKGTVFQNEVWEIVKRIPYGKVMTYQEIAEKLAHKKGLAKMSNQAVGQAVAQNPFIIIIPCHRVIGSNGALIGYAGGLERKQALLKLENVERRKQIK